MPFTTGRCQRRHAPLDQLLDHGCVTSSACRYSPRVSDRRYLRPPIGRPDRRAGTPRSPGAARPGADDCAHDQDDSLIIETRRLIAARPEVVLVTTGYGMRRWLEVADAAGLGAELTAALEGARIFARGSKAHGAVRAAGLLDAQTGDLDTTASLVDSVIAAGLSNRRVAVQLHGYIDEVALSRLAEISDCVMTVTPYRWAQPNPPERLARLIRAACQ